ncbi:MAG: 4'-phosphopantetheinyl transferase family protein [Cytophagales bacterium]
MPFLKEFIINHNTKIKLWKLSLGELDYYELDEYDSNLINLKKNKLAKEQFLAVRKTLKLENPSYKIRYDESGKPSINSDLNISISHSHHMAAIVFSGSSRIGIDIELKASKILNIQDKFLNESEKLKKEFQSDVDYLIMIWTAKESIYKALGIKRVSFSNDIIIKNISDNKGEGYYVRGKENDKFDLIFFSIDDYILCYAQSNN